MKILVVSFFQNLVSSIGAQVSWLLSGKKKTLRNNLIYCRDLFRILILCVPSVYRFFANTCLTVIRYQKIAGDEQPSLKNCGCNSIHSTRAKQAPVLQLILQNGIETKVCHNFYHIKFGLSEKITNLLCFRQTKRLQRSPWENSSMH